MTDTKKQLRKKYSHIASIFVAMCSVMYVGTIHAASVAKRANNTARARIPVASTQSTDVAAVAEPETKTIDEPKEIVEETFEFEDRTTMFDDAIGGASASNEMSDDDLAKMIRKQRESLNASAATTTATNTARAAISSNQNACDMGLRKCMMAKCGNDFAKCAGDTDTTWGDKMDTCRRDLKCSGNEYKLFANEIKADRDLNAQLANYNAIIKCGNEYNACIVSQCGPTYSKCLGKSAGDLAISKCKKIQDNCTQMDNGLASRTMNVFGTLRVDAEKQIQRDEQRLYDMRDEMESVCRRMGAMFDQRSLDCVYTVNFFANNSTTPYASKKAYAGGTFNCDPGWFGIDVTTFKENAYRLTAAQRSASAAMLGSGVGMAAGAISSGAIDRAIDTQKAKKELKKAEAGDQPDKKAQRQAKRKERANNKINQKPTGEGSDTQGATEGKEGDTGTPPAEGSNPTTTPTTTTTNTGATDNKDDNNDQSAEQIMCDAVGGEWEDNKCTCKNMEGETITTEDPEKCANQNNQVETTTKTGETGNTDDKNDRSTEQIMCDTVGGKWEDNKCTCKNMEGETITTNDPKQCITEVTEEPVDEDPLPEYKQEQDKNVEFVQNPDFPEMTIDAEDKTAIEKYKQLCSDNVGTIKFDDTALDSSSSKLRNFYKSRYGKEADTVFPYAYFGVSSLKEMNYNCYWPNDEINETNHEKHVAICKKIIDSMPDSLIEIIDEEWYEENIADQYDTFCNLSILGTYKR